MLNCVYLLLPFCLLSDNLFIQECTTTALTGATPKLVIGKNGDKVTLPCEHEDGEIYLIKFSQTEFIPVCQTEECSGRVFKEGACDVVIEDLSFSDAGKYILRVYYSNDETELEQTRTYQLCVQDEISVKIGEELKLDVLLLNTDKVQHQSRRSTGWKEVWSRTDRVQSERMIIRDGNLIIKEFRPRDAGTYEVLDSEGNILIMLTVKNEISVKTDEELKLSDADKVQHQSKITERKEDWSRNDRVQSEQMTDKNGNLINTEYTNSDAEKDAVLDSEGETVITMKACLLLPVKLSISPVGLSVLLLILVAFKRKKLFRCRNIA